MKKALVVGINGYGFPNDLPSAVRDAEAFANVLDTVYRFDHVRVLTDGDATRDGVDRGLEWLCQSANTNDRLVVFFSGHGCRFERNGVLEDALVLQDGRLLDQHHLADRTENVPAGIFTLVLDCCFSGPDETLIHPSGQVEVARAKRWIPTELDRGRSERSVTPGLKAFAPFGHAKPAPPSTLAAYIRNAAPLDGSPARLTTLDEPQAKALIVLPCLADETTPVATAQTNGLSPFTHGLVNAIRRLGPNRSAIEVLQATGHELRQLGLDQTPLVMEPAEPEHLGLRAFLTFQPVLFVHPASTPGKEEIAEAVRSTLINIKEGRSMQATIPGAQTFLASSCRARRGVVTARFPYTGSGGAHRPPLPRRTVYRSLDIDATFSHRYAPCMAGDELETRRWKRVEYDRLIECGFFQPGDPIELVGGQLIVAEPQGSRHSTAIRAVDEALRVAFGTGWDVRTQLPVALDDESEPEPDVAVVPGSFRDYVTNHPSRPVLVVEVSESSLAFDRAHKGSLYARAGLADYWIVNLIDRVLEVYREPVRDADAAFGWRYRSVTVHGPAAAVFPLARPEASVRVSDVVF